RELGEVLLQYKLIGKDKLAVAQRLAKMSKPAPRATPAQPALAKEPAPTKDGVRAPSKDSKDPAPPPTSTESELSTKDTTPIADGVARRTPAAPRGTPATELPTPLLTPRVELTPRIKLAADRTSFGRYEVVGK